MTMSPAFNLVLHSYWDRCFGLAAAGGRDKAEAVRLTEA
jgi:hypothetical protein